MTWEDLKEGDRIVYRPIGESDDETITVDLVGGDDCGLIFTEEGDEFKVDWIDYLLANGAEVRSSEGRKIWPDETMSSLKSTKLAPQEPRP